jgi:hypothetical protein
VRSAATAIEGSADNSAGSRLLFPLARLLRCSLQVAGAFPLHKLTSLGPCVHGLGNEAKICCVFNERKFL